MDSECVISTDGLAKAFGRRFSRKKIHALRGVTLSVHHGQIFALLGPNGAGKTTLIKILLGIIRRSAGKASLFHLPAGDRRSRQRIGYLPEQLKLPRHQTARTALEYYGRLSGMSHADIRAKRDGILDTVGLAGRDRESVRRFSKGMQQRLGLAQAMLHDPDLLILDEPTDGLDPVGRAQVRSILVGLREGGKTIFINSHLLQEVELICDQIAILDQGSLRFSGTLEELTPTHENTIGMEVLGKPSEIKAALQSCEPFDVLDEDNGITRLAIPFDDQAKIDAIVDQLRQNKLSIQRLSKQRKTLEDAFMDLIHAPRQNG